MTANCPMCGAKWFSKEDDYCLILRCGDEHDIHCVHCEYTLEFVLSREDLELVNNNVLRGYESTINDLERQLKEEKKKNEN